MSQALNQFLILKKKKVFMRGADYLTCNSCSFQYSLEVLSDLQYLRDWMLNKVLCS